MDSHHGGRADTRRGRRPGPHPVYQATNARSIYARTYKLLEPMDYLNLRLTGRFSASYATVFPYMLTDNRNVNRRLLTTTDCCS